MIDMAPASSAPCAGGPPASLTSLVPRQRALVQITCGSSLGDKPHLREIALAQLRVLDEVVQREILP